MKTLIVLSDQSHCDKLTGVHLAETDEIILATFTPGLSLPSVIVDQLKDKFKVPVQVCMLETYCDNITQIDISRRATQFTLNILKSIKKNVKADEFHESNTLLDCQTNLLAQVMHPLFSFALFLDSFLTNQKIDLVYIFGNKNHLFTLPERPDVKTLYNSDFVFGPLADKICTHHRIKIKFLKNFSPSVVLAKLKLRHLLIQSYKFAETFKRVLKTKNTVKVSKKNPEIFNSILILVRSESEYWSIKPLYEKLLKDTGYTPILIQDDLIKDPSALKTLRENQVEFTPIHSKETAFGMILPWISQFLKRRKYIRVILKNVSFRGTINTADSNYLENIFLSNRFIGEILKSSTCLYPEISLFQNEFKLLCDEYAPKALINLDMVSQWAGIIGKIGLDYNVPTFTLQNTSLDKIIYPKAVSTDFFWVGNNNIRSIFCLSSIKPETVIVTGLPMHDSLLQSLPIEVNGCDTEVYSPQKETIFLIATQPFVQKYPYNINLINNLCNILQDKKNIRIIVKVHPREKKDQYIELLEACRNKFKIVIELAADVNIIDLIKTSTVMVSRTSTAMMTSVLINIPTISYMEGYQIDILDRLDYLGTDAVHKAYNYDELEDICKSIVSNKAKKGGYLENFLAYRKAYVEEYVGAPQGDACARIMKHLRTHLKSDIIRNK